MSWPMVKLSDVAEIERSGIAPQAIVSGTQYLGLEHIEAGGRILSSESVAGGELASSKFRFGPDHILYGKLRPYLAKIALPDFTGICSTDIVPIRPGKKVDKRYLAYFLRQPAMVAFAASRSSGINLPRLSPNALADFDLPLPPLPEQKRIAAILGQAYEVRRKLADSLKMRDRLRDSIFEKVFGDPAENPNGWVASSYRYVSTRITVGVVVKPASYYVEDGVPAIRGTNIKADGIDLSDAVYFSDADNTQTHAKTRIWQGDLVIVRSGRPGLAAVVPEELDGINAIDVLILTPDQTVATPRFLCDLINSSSGRRMILSESRGQVQQHFNVGSLSKAPLFVPPLKLQKAYEETMRDVDDSFHRLRMSAQLTTSLFNSLQHRAFRGEL